MQLPSDLPAHHPLCSAHLNRSSSNGAKVADAASVEGRKDKVCESADAPASDLTCESISDRQRRMRTNTHRRHFSALSGTFRVVTTVLSSWDSLISLHAY